MGNNDMPDMNEYLKIIESVCSNFKLCIYINTKDMSYRFIDELTGGLVEDKKEDAFTFIRNKIVPSVDVSYRGVLNDWIQPDVIESELENNQSTSKDFCRSDGKLFKGFFIVVDRDDDCSVSRLIFGCLDITDVKEQALNTLEISDHQLQILHVLAGLFNSMHLIDLRNDSFISFNSGVAVSRMVSKNTSTRELMSRVISALTTEAYRKDALFFTDLSTVAERMKDKKMISQEFMGTRVGWFVASFIRVESDENGIASKVLFSTRVIDKEKKREEKLFRESNTDQLTGLYNRRAYEDAVNELSEKELGSDFVYVSIDINGLKVANDTIGHEAGDELIVGASDCMRKCLKSYGSIYRTGGDEFIALIEADENQVEQIKNDIEESTGRWKGSLVEKLSLSCGFVAASEVPHLSLHEISVLADKRMYAAKADYYRTNGIDRRGQLDAHKALGELYTKILKINVTKDTSSILRMDASEQTPEKGYSEKISQWFISFAKTGQVHPEDQEEFLSHTDLNFLRSYFDGDRKALHIFYRRKNGDAFEQHMMEIIPANDYEENNKTLFLYVKNIDR